MKVTDDQLFEILKKDQYVPEFSLVKAAEIAKNKQESLFDTLVDMDLMTDENLGKVVADALKLPIIVLTKTAISQEVLHLIPEIVARKNKIIAFARDEAGLKVATPATDNTEIIDFLAKKTGDKIHLFYATRKEVIESLSLYKKEIQKSFNELLGTQDSKTFKGDVSIEKAVNLLLEYAYYNKASDVHIEPEDKKCLIRFRIDGVLHDVTTLPRSLHDQIVSRIKVLSRLRTDEHLSAQDGKMQYHTEEESLDVRVSIVPIVDGEKVVLRLLSSKSRQFSLSTIGMTGPDLNKVISGFNKPYGMILATGPTGSGKTTTIYAVLKILNTRERNIATIEDPVEYDIGGINQIQVNAKTNLTFANGLKAILRQDPDVIFVGEIRDEDTARIAINSAMTGHLVLSTLHTNNAATTLPRLVDMGIEPFLVASTVNVIIAQRLVRKICEKCRQTSSVAVKELEQHIPLETLKKYLGIVGGKARVYFGKGCAVCDKTGYVGRIGVFEVLIVNEVLREMIVSKVDSSLLMKKAQEEGMTSILEDGLEKVSKGLTSIEEILKATKE